MDSTVKKQTVKPTNVRPYVHSEKYVHLAVHLVIGFICLCVLTEFRKTQLPAFRSREVLIPISGVQPLLQNGFDHNMH